MFVEKWKSARPSDFFDLFFSLFVVVILYRNGKYNWSVSKPNGFSVSVCRCAAAYVLLAEEEATTITEAERLFRKALTIGREAHERTIGRTRCKVECRAAVVDPWLCDVLCHTCSAAGCRSTSHPITSVLFLIKNLKASSLFAY